MPAIRDEEYAAVAERERPLLQAMAYLLTGDPVQAERVVQLVLAELYGRWPKVTQPRLEGLRALVHTARAPVYLPWEYRERVELIDGPPATPPASESSPICERSAMTCGPPLPWRATPDWPSGRSRKSSTVPSTRCVCWRGRRSPVWLPGTRSVRARKPSSRNSPVPSRTICANRTAAPMMI